MQHDVEAKCEGHEEEGVPEKEGEEGLEHFVEHGDVDIVSGEPGVLGHEQDELGPGQQNDDRRHMSQAGARRVGRAAGQRFSTWKHIGFSRGRALLVGEPSWFRATENWSLSENQGRSCETRGL